MVKVMCRKIAIFALLGGLAAGLGCHHIAGTSDCGYNPSDYPIGQPTPPYPATLVPTKPADLVPKTKLGGSDSPGKSFESGVPGIDY